jgi:hypothetical protein
MTAPRDAGVLSSISDAPNYRDICRQAAEDPAVFASFREHPTYRWVVSTDLLHQAQDFRQVLSQRGFDFSFFDRIRDLDQIGGVRLVDYQDAGAVAPQTMRYVKALSDIERLFPTLDGKSVIEIGVGFGGQCAVLSRRFQLARYTLVDLPEPLMLARRYLESLAIPEVAFATLAELSPSAHYDLVISAYGISEIARPFQVDYVQRALQRAAAGYLLWNSEQMKTVQGWHQRVFGGEQIHADEMLSLLPEARFLETDWLAISEIEFGVRMMAWGMI